MKKQALLSIQRTNFKEQCSIAFTDLPCSLDLLHPQELAQYHEYTFKRRQESYLLGRAAVKEALQLLFPKVPSVSFNIGAGVFDFPVVSCEEKLPTNIQVSLSHCEGRGLALAFPEEHPMGIDLEMVKPAQIEALQSQMTAQDLKYLTAITKTSAEGLTLLWGMKESLAKILKTGLMLDFKLLSTASLIAKDKSYIATFEHFPQYKAIGYIHKGYTYAIALPERTAIDMTAFEQMVYG